MRRCQSRAAGLICSCSRAARRLLESPDGNLAARSAIRFIISSCSNPNRERTMSESNQPVIEIRDLHHAYKRQQAIRGISFTVDQGSIHGFVGPNGAGKTTTL